MAFEVRCPDCRKLYSAEWRLVGKRIRCRQCAQIFTVGAPAETSALVMAGAAVEADGTAPVATADGSDTAAVVLVPRQPADDDPIAAAHFEDDRTPLRASRPQQFPGSQILEAWLPLALGLIAVIWCASETFTENHTGKGWVPLLRMAAVVALYMLLIVPVTLTAVRKQFARAGRALPPSTMQRVAVTFALPVTLAYVFWLVSGGIPAVITGLVLGLVLMAAVFWLLFRLDAEECATSYAIVGGVFLAATVVAVGLLCGANFLLNRAMMASHATAFKESPLGTALAWQVPSPEPAKIRSRPGRSTDAGTVADASPQTPDAGPTEQPVRSSLPVPGRTSEPPDHSSVAFTFPRPLPTTSPLTTSPTADETDLDSGVSELFGPAGPPSLSDAFMESIQQAKLPWVQRVYRPADEGVFEDSLAPITPSPYIGLVRMAGVGGKMLECCRLTPWFRGVGGVPMSADGSDSPSFSGRCALSSDGKFLLRLTTDPGPQVKVVPFHGAERAIVLTPPKAAETSRAAREDTLLTPELLGALPRQRFVVRWSRTGKWILQVYSLAAPDDKPSPTEIQGEGDSNSVYAVSADGNWFATVIERPDNSVVAVYSLTIADAKPKALSLTGIADPAQWEWSGLAFSPDGAKIAAMLERDTDGIIRSWTIATGRPAGSGSCKVPSADERLGHARGRLFDCLADNIWLAAGRTLLDAASGRVLGTLTSDVVISQQVADAHTVYLSYALGEGGRHVAVVKLDTEALNGASGRSSPH